MLPSLAVAIIALAIRSRERLSYPPTRITGCHSQRTAGSQSRWTGSVGSELHDPEVVPRRATGEWAYGNLVVDY